jgi:trehalose 6-phosphate phosphatase
MEPLLTRGWDAILPSIERAEHVLLATDFDGTLAPIVSDPELAQMSVLDRDALRAICANDGYSVAIVTGRQMEEIRRLVQLDDVYYAANYGMEIDGPDGFRFREPEGERIRSLVTSLAPQLSDSLADISGVVVENKALSITVHHRHVAAEFLTTVSRRVSEITAPAVSGGHIRVSNGNRQAIEIVPVNATNKGIAIALILEHVGKTGIQPWPMYMGDDVMDEQGFRLVNDRGGASIIISPGGKDETEAQFFANKPADVSQLISRMVSVSPGRLWS